MTRRPAGLRLTKESVEALACPPGRKDLLVFDSELTGFGVRVTSTGTKVFLLQYRIGTTVRRMPIGEFGVFTAAQARKRAEVLRGQVRDGRDPVAERAAQRAAQVAAAAAARRAADAEILTFGRLVELWRDRHLASQRERYRREAVRALQQAFPDWRTRLADSIAPAEVIEQLDRIGGDSGPGAARLAYAYGRAMYGWAIGAQLLTGNPFATIAAPKRVTARDRTLSDAELAEVWRAACTLQFPFGPWIRLLVLTLQRREEVAGMRWSELSRDFMVWTLPASRAKNGREHKVHMAPAARAILRDVPRLEGCDFVFPASPRRRRRPEEDSAAAAHDAARGDRYVPISGFSDAKEQLDGAIVAARKKARRQPHALTPWRFHDLRRTGVTRLAELGTPPHVADRILNHVTGQIEGVAAVYQRAEFLTERKTALEAWARHVLSVGNGKPSDRRTEQATDSNPTRGATKARPARGAGQN